MNEILNEIEDQARAIGIEYEFQSHKIVELVGKLRDHNRAPPTPASLRELAAWYDENAPNLEVSVCAHKGPPGYLLRRIAYELERAPR